MTDVNSRSIGIELANDGRAPFAARQIDALIRLLADLRSRWRIPPERVIAHSDMAPARKGDPGAGFDWRALALAGQSVWPVAGEGDRSFGDALRGFGYPDAAADVLQMGKKSARVQF